MRCKLGRQKYVKGAARHGQGHVLTQVIAAVNARNKRMLVLELVTEVALDLLAFAISNAKLLLRVCATKYVTMLCTIV
ncbi:hypothetical protein H5410_035600 [Solanum commersonii]|uniref:Uncharacterized protein n=1 Tax=Solanum commersonii TaxID=4109 RepID=A0A9J5Y472_SOLCO|nr:hypothetical protein H5410_035600 [Solanum commersonii]